MTDSLEGLSKVYAIQAKLEALKNAKNERVDPDTFLIDTQQNFNSMLNTLVTPSGKENESGSSSDYLSYLENDSTSALNTAALQKLAAMEQYAPLIGRTVTYYGTDSNEERSGVISRIAFNSSSTPLLVLEDGTQLPAGAVTGLK